MEHTDKDHSGRHSWVNERGCTWLRVTWLKDSGQPRPCPTALRPEAVNNTLHTYNSFLVCQVGISQLTICRRPIHSSVMLLVRVALSRCSGNREWFLIEVVRKMLMQLTIYEKSISTQCVHAQARIGPGIKVQPLHGLAGNQFHPDSCSKEGKVIH